MKHLIAILTTVLVALLLLASIGFYFVPESYIKSEPIQLLPVSEDLYSYFKSLPRPLTQDYALYVVNPTDDPYVADFMEQNNITDLDGIVHFALYNITYIEDSDPIEYPNYPLETLASRIGDCEDKAILAAQMLYIIGYNVALIRLPRHMAVGIKLDGIPSFKDGYAFLEVTQLGYEPGQHFEEYSPSSSSVYPVTDRPIIVVNTQNSSLWKNYFYHFTQASIIANNYGLTLDFITVRFNTSISKVTKDVVIPPFSSENITCQLSSGYPDRLSVNVTGSNGYVYENHYNFNDSKN